MNALILPSSGKITHIIHISDIHIKTGDLEKSRYNDYQQTITNLEQIISNLPFVKNHTAITILCGDVFDTKDKLNSFSVKLFYILINMIAKYTPLYFFQGNHDVVQSQADSIDMIPSLLTGYTNPYVCYLDKTGLYTAGNVGIGFVNIKDTLILGNGSGHLEQLPPFPDATQFPAEIVHKIAVYSSNGNFNNTLYSPPSTSRLI